MLLNRTYTVLLHLALNGRSGTSSNCDARQARVGTAESSHVLGAEYKYQVVLARAKASLRAGQCNITNKCRSVRLVCSNLASVGPVKTCLVGCAGLSGSDWSGLARFGGCSRRHSGSQPHAAPPSGHSGGWGSRHVGRHSRPAPAGAGRRACGGKGQRTQH